MTKLYFFKMGLVVVIFDLWFIHLLRELKLGKPFYFILLLIKTQGKLPLGQQPVGLLPISSNSTTKI